MKYFVFNENVIEYYFPNYGHYQPIIFCLNVYIVILKDYLYFVLTSGMCPNRSFKRLGLCGFVCCR